MIAVSKFHYVIFDVRYPDLQITIFLFKKEKKKVHVQFSEPLKCRTSNSTKTVCFGYGVG